LRVGDNREPFPKEYEHPTTRPDYLARLDLRPKQMHVVISDQGVVPAVKRAPVRIVVGSDDAQAGEKPSTQTSAGASEAAAAGAAGSDKPAAPAYQKGKGEQEAYDLLVSSSKALSEMLKGSNPALKFQDWGAAAMGENSYNVMVTFVQAAGDVPQKYIWNVKLSSKEVIPVNSLAMSISR
jgi:hypothetical protein